MLKHALPLLCLVGVTVTAAPTAAAEPVDFDQHIRPVFRRHCVACHGNDRHEADLNLQNYAASLKGGSAGKAFVSGRASASLLYKAITAEDEDARMPLNSPSLPKEQIELIRRWIQEGLRQSSDSKAMVDERDLTFHPAVNAGARPDGPPPMPAELPPVKLPDTVRSLPVLALDVSPWAPLAAVAGQEHVRLVHTETRKELGILPFPEGVPHVIRFSRDGTVLLVAGGRPVQSGRVVLYDVRSGQRLAEIGDEIDAVLAADISPDQKLVALGGPGKTVKVYSTSDGKLQYKLTKHTDWITAVGFSPDGTRLATADRAGGLHLWEPESGGILLTLAEHKSAVRSLHWRSDSRLLATAGEDGLLVWWDTKDGWPAISRPNAHPPRRPAGTYGKLNNGVLSASFGPGGNLLTAGRDGVIRLWDPAGNPGESFPAGEGLPLVARISGDGKVLLGGDARGQLHFWSNPKSPKPEAGRKDSE